MRSCVHSHNYHKARSNAVPHGTLGRKAVMFSWYDTSILTLPFLTIKNIKSSQLFKTALLYTVCIYVSEYDVLALAYVRDSSVVWERETGQVCMCRGAWYRSEDDLIHLLSCLGQGCLFPIHCIGQSTRPSIPRRPPVSASCLALGALRLETWAENPDFRLVLRINAQIFMFVWQAHYSLNWLSSQYLYFSVLILSSGNQTTSFSV